MVASYMELFHDKPFHSMTLPHCLKTLPNSTEGSKLYVVSSVLDQL